MSSSISKRVKSQSNFTVIQNTLINSTLSLEAKALLIWALSKPSGWKVTTVSLATNHDCSKGKIQRIVNELKNSGYLLIHKLSTGQTEWHWYESPVNMGGVSSEDKNYSQPHPKNEDMDIEPHPKKPDPKKPDPNIQDVLVSKDLLVKKDLLVSISPDELFEQVWGVWYNKKNKAKSLISFKRFLKAQPKGTEQQATDFLAADIKKRRMKQQAGFDAMHMTTYLNNSRYLDDHR